MSVELLIEEVKAAKPYRCICEATIERICREEFPKYRKHKDAVKAVKSKLHQISSAFFPGLPHGAKGAAEPSARMRELLGAHASTKERLGFYRQMLDDIASVTGPFESVLDVACGVNPILWALYCLEKGCATPRITAYDLHKEAVEWVRWAFACLGVDGHADVLDVLVQLPEDRAQLALLCKIVPLLEQQQKGATCRVLQGLRARFVAVTFPTRTMGGRDLGMLAHYRRTFEPLIQPSGYTLALERQYPNELLFVLEKEGEEGDWR